MKHTTLDNLSANTLQSYQDVLNDHHMVNDERILPTAHAVNMLLENYEIDYNNEVITKAVFTEYIHQIRDCLINCSMKYSGMIGSN